MPRADLVIRPLAPTDHAGWLQMRQTLWPDCPADVHRHEMALLMHGQSGQDTAVFVADDHGVLVGFVEVSVRPFAEGCHRGRVGYVEGWYVAATHRGQGVGHALLTAVEHWARQQGCTEMASDTEPDNATSRAAHRRAGYTEVGALVHFRKSLAPSL